MQEALKDAAAAADGALSKLAEKLKSVDTAEAAKQEQALAALADEVTAPCVLGPRGSGGSGSQHFTRRAHVVRRRRCGIRRGARQCAHHLVQASG